MLSLVSQFELLSLLFLLLILLGLLGLDARGFCPAFSLCFLLKHNRLCGSLIRLPVFTLLRFFNLLASLGIVESLLLFGRSDLLVDVWSHVDEVACVSERFDVVQIHRFLDRMQHLIAFHELHCPVSHLLRVVLAEHFMGPRQHLLRNPVDAKRQL